jgi:hypothetical protein|tara:strand:- start:24 stop:170 length:147 start_codon:yes stop_codon:yes gene_type:complete
VEKAVEDKEMAELRIHNKIIDEKEKELKIKHQEMWKKKKKNRRGFNER